VKIERLDLYHVAMPLISPFRTAFGNDDCVESVFVRMWSGGQYGWGEAAPWRDPAYSPEWAGGAFILVRDKLAPRLLGQDLRSGQELQQALAGVKGNYFAKASLDLAWWDLHARQLGRPLWSVLRGSGPVVEVGADIGVLESTEALLLEIDQAQQAGFKRLKLKYRPGWELGMIAAVRARFPDMVIHVDCNSAYSLAQLPMFRELDRFDLAMIEQPLAHDDLLDHSRLQSEIATPVCLDESIVSPEKARKATELKACSWINIKHGRVGGLTSAVAIHDLCLSAGVPCWVGGMLESAVGQAHSIALASLPNIHYPSDIFPSRRFYHEDLGEPAVDLCAPSRVRASDGAGIGVEPHPERLRRQTLQRAELR